jgi:hypothetical protein
MIRGLRVGLIGAALALCGCGWVGRVTNGTKPMAQLVQAGQCPVETVVSQQGISPLPTFGMNLRNTSDKKIDFIAWTVVYHRANGSLCGEPREGGFCESRGLKPGESAMSTLSASSNDAVNASVLIRTVAYTDKIKGSVAQETWKNPDYEAELKAAVSTP